MSRKLEQFINEHRGEFDTDEPREKIWEHIQNDLANPLKKRAVKPLWPMRWIAAASVLIIVSLGIYVSVEKSAKPGIAGARTADDILHEINPTYAKEVYHFTQLIELKQNELKRIGQDQPELYEQFMNDISMLDSTYNSFQKELPANPNREQLLEAMIQNLQLQTELLNQQLRVIKQIKESKKSNNENTSTI
jgi:hypothetical protein